MTEVQSKSPRRRTGITKILIMRWGGIGDFLLTLPAIAAVRRHSPQAHLAIMGSSDALELAATREYADEFLQFDRDLSSHLQKAREAARQRMMQTLQKYDFIINYHSFGQIDGLLADCGVPYANFDEQVFYRERKHASEHFSDFVRSLGASTILSRPKVYLSAEEEQFSRNFFNNHGVDFKTDCMVAVHVGSGDPRKRWFPDRFQQVIRWLVGNGVKVLLLLGPHDDDIVRLVYEGGEQENVMVVHDLPIRQVAAILRRATLFLGNDSGLMHLASAVGLPIVSLFGPSDPVTWGPLGPRHVVLQGHCPIPDLDGEICQACASQECLDSIKTEEVIREVRERLKYLRNLLSTHCLGCHLPFRGE